FNSNSHIPIHSNKLHFSWWKTSHLSAYLKVGSQAKEILMTSFKYHLNQEKIELLASDWIGLERVLVNDKIVSTKVNFGQRSTHKIKLNNGKPCRLQLLIDPQTERLTCKLYKQNEFIASLKQGKQSFLSSKTVFEASLMLACMSSLGLYWLS
ncbi:hypothetical protein, partial [Shewanella sp. KT0246]|uniref:hypothetical protein n=2 Tax=Shewanella TaxID=22 RepID=UPI0027E57CA1